jgi:hypothetical protein
VNILFLGLFFLGAWIRSLDVWRPVDGRVRESWRECDYAAVARNFYREGMNILYPRIDWRGDGPGYAEMEFGKNSCKNISQARQLLSRTIHLIGIDFLSLAIPKPW